MKTLLEIKNLTKVYNPGKRDELIALNDVSLDIAEGEVLGLLGVNGAGKTTLSSILATLHPPTSGDVLFHGKSIYRDLNQYKYHLGFCPQRPNLDPLLNVEENLVFAGRYFLLSQETIRHNVEALLERFNLQRYRTFKVSALSGGYKQRLLIARAMMHNPRVILFDEPTVGLDPNVRRQIWKEIEALRADGVTVVLTTHYLDEAEYLCDRVCILNKGKILLIDKAENLKKSYQKGNLEEVFLHLTQEGSQ